MAVDCAVPVPGSVRSGPARGASRRSLDRVNRSEIQERPEQRG